jgi:hypothetical protein
MGFVLQYCTLASLTATPQMGFTNLCLIKYNLLIFNIQIKDVNKKYFSRSPYCSLNQGCVVGVGRNFRLSRSR